MGTNGSNSNTNQPPIPLYQVSDSSSSISESFGNYTDSDNSGDIQVIYDSLHPVVTISDDSEEGRNNEVIIERGIVTDNTVHPSSVSAEDTNKKVRPNPNVTDKLTKRSRNKVKVDRSQISDHGRYTDSDYDADNEEENKDEEDENEEEDDDDANDCVFIESSYNDDNENSGKRKQKFDKTNNHFDGIKKRSRCDNNDKSGKLTPIENCLKEDTRSEQTKRENNDQDANRNDSFSISNK